MRKTNVITASLVFIASAAAAQINPFGHHSVDRLTAEDRQLAEQASAKLYQAPAPQIGASESWNNPSTGNHGTVALIGVREHQGLPCRTLRHRLEIQGVAKPIEFVLNRCRTGDGQWKIL